MTEQEERDLREKIAQDIEKLMGPQGADGRILESVIAVLWIKKCAKIARGE